LRTAFETAGFKVDLVKKIFNGQYLWLEASIEKKNTVISSNEGGIYGMIDQYAQVENDLIATWEKRIKELLIKGRVAVWGAGAKGITFVNLVDPQNKYLECIVDLNPNKQGGYSPGTGHPIIGYNELKTRGITHAILINPNYRKENEELLQKAKIEIELIE
jgi:hypothetical protein